MSSRGYDLLGWVVLGEFVGLAAAAAYVLVEQAYRRRVLRRAVLLMLPAPVVSARPPTPLAAGGVWVAREGWPGDLGPDTKHGPQS